MTGAQETGNKELQVRNWHLKKKMTGKKSEAKKVQKKTGILGK